MSSNTGNIGGDALFTDTPLPAAARPTVEDDTVNDHATVDVPGLQTVSTANTLEEEVNETCTNILRQVAKISGCLVLPQDETKALDWLKHWRGGKARSLSYLSYANLTWYTRHKCREFQSEAYTGLDRAHLGMYISQWREGRDVPALADILSGPVLSSTLSKVYERWGRLPKDILQKFLTQQRRTVSHEMHGPRPPGGPGFKLSSEWYQPIRANVAGYMS